MAPFANGVGMPPVIVSTSMAIGMSLSIGAFFIVAVDIVMPLLGASAIPTVNGLDKVA